MKTIRATSITGEKGIALIHQVALDMGCLWHSTGGLEAGTDGFIEFRDPATGGMPNLHLAVQSKATTGRFSSESDTHLSYVCKPEDLEYWLKGNQPIVLVVSRPDTGEAYWASLKDYFRDPQIRKTRKVTFDKVRDRFDKAAYHRLLDVASLHAGGTYLAPAPVREPIVSNLLRVERLPSQLYHGDTDCASGKVVWERLKAVNAQDVNEWVIRGKKILSVHDLSAGPWRAICDQGTVEAFDVEEWAQSADEEQRKDFVALLNQCLRTRLKALYVRFDLDGGYYHFQAKPDLRPRDVRYMSLARKSRRTVVRAYADKLDGDQTAYHRHHAFYARFRRYGEEWFLQIDPTYRFTSDGRTVSSLAPALMAGIRKLERNPAVLGQVVMWAALLADLDTHDLFPPARYPHLGFGELVTFESPVGIDEREWLSTDDDPAAQQAMEQAEYEFGLFAPDGVQSHSEVSE